MPWAGIHITGVMRHFLAPATFLALSSLAIAGCDPGALQSVGSSGDASTGLRALIGAINGGGASQLHVNPETGLSFRALPAEGAGDIDVSGQCGDGGTVSFEGELTITGEAAADLDDFDPLDGDADDIDVQVPTVSFEYTVTFDGCGQDGVEIDGAMTFTLESDWDADALELSMDWGFAGSVDFAGAAVGHCDFEFDGRSSSAEAEGWTEVNLSAVDGTACGYEADVVLDD